MVSARCDSQPATDPPDSGLTAPASAERRRALVAGHTGDAAGALELSRHVEPSVRAAAIGSLDKAGHLSPDLILGALDDPDRWVRRRACELAGRQAVKGADLGRILDSLVARLSDKEPLVAEAAAWALGELTPAARPRARRAVADSLGAVVTGHSDPLPREAAVAALGAIGDASSIDNVLDALADKPPIRRRAVVALAAFDDPRADVALQRCLTDRDWQVRQAAEDILGRL
jgi:HEAT repeat protein